MYIYDNNKYEFTRITKYVYTYKFIYYIFLNKIIIFYRTKHRNKIFCIHGY